MPIPEPFRVAVPRTVEPAVNVTDPLGVAVGELTVAVNITFLPSADGLVEGATFVVVIA